jgi:trehalose-phosphatase
MFLDFDGTLAPITRCPEAARLPAAAARLLLSLSAAPGVSLALVSGRALADLRRRARLAGVTYSGNHGLEIEGPDGRFVHPVAQARRRALALLCRRLERALQHLPGAQVENKGLTASVHFRRVAAARAVEVPAAVEGAVRRYSRTFTLRAGKRVIEILPPTRWNKGTAVRWIAARRPPGLALYCGDDATDEDGFAAFPEGITVRVGAPAATRAAYHASDPGDLRRFLVWVRAVLGGRRRPAGAPD